MHSSQNIVDIVLGQHDLRDLPEVLRLILFHPEDLGSCETCKRNISSQRGQFFLANFIIEVVHLFGGSAVIPEDGRTDDVVVFIQHHQAMHLTSAADTGYSICIKAFQQFRHILKERLFPILRVLLAPAGLGKFQGIFLRDGVVDGAGSIHQQQLHGRGTKINANIVIHSILHSFCQRITGLSPSHSMGSQT